MLSSLLQNWPILLPTALGLAAVYLLLPRARRFPPALGAVLAGLALVAAGWLLIRADWHPVETVLFYAFAGLAVTFGGLMITQRNPIHAALYFAMVVLSTCGLFLLQAAPFLMAATIIIYAGAIVVTFLFVIMLAQQGGLSSADQRSREPFLATVAGFVLLASLLWVLQKSYSGIDHFVAQANRAAAVDTVKEWSGIIGPDDKFFLDFRFAVFPTRSGFSRANEPNTEARARLSDVIEECRRLWNAVKPRSDGQDRDPSPAEIKRFKDELDELCRIAAVVRDNQGGLRPAEQLPLSAASGQPANAPPVIGKDSKPAERLPAANVAGLGKSLFTDYLLAVELAGTLLLVATIGAIAIAGRRREGL